MKKPAKYVPPREIMIGPDLLIIMDDAEYWDRASTNPQLDLRKKDWDNFNPSECEPLDMYWLENVALMCDQGNLKSQTHEGPLISYDIDSNTAVITINRADKRNALSRELIRALTDAFQRAKDDSAARCVILTGAGSVFCAGMDLAELQESLDIPKEQTPVWNDAVRLAKLYDLIYTLPKPTIAAVQGTAVAGGAGLVTVCDLAVSVPEAKFGYPEVRRGLVAAMVMPHLTRHVGERMARSLLLTGELIDANEAARCGLINEVVPADHLLERALALAKACAEGGPNALAKTKEFLHQFSRQALSIEAAAKGSAEPRLTEECQQGLRAFFAKKAAPWTQP